MKRKFTTTLLFSIGMLFLTFTVQSQFFTYLPEVSNHLRGDVKNEGTGLTFNYRLQDEGTFAISTVFVHTDNNGQVEWMKSASTNFSSYTVAPDNSIIVTGSATTSGGDVIALLQKQDANGTILWKKSLGFPSSDIRISNLLIGANNMIFATVTSSSVFNNNTLSKSAVVAYDMNGDLLWIQHFSNATLTTEYHFSRAMIAQNGDFIGVGDIKGNAKVPENGMMITRITPLGTVMFSKYIDFKTTHSQLSVTGLAETATNDLIFGGRLMADQISMQNNTMWLAKLDSDGNLAMQRTYHGGENVGEQLHSLIYNNGKLFAYLTLYSPSNAVKNSLYIGTIDENTLAFSSQNAMEITPSLEDPSDIVNNPFCITSDGKPTVAAGFYCEEKGKYFPLMSQWTENLISSCTQRDVIQPLDDSTAHYNFSNYTSHGSFNINLETDTSVILLTTIALPITADLCGGCAAIAFVAETTPQNEMFHVYPNPSNGRYFIEIEESFKGAQIIISNNLGAIVYQSEIQDTHQTIDLTEQSSGIYFVRVQTIEGRVSTSKIIKN